MRANCWVRPRKVEMRDVPDPSILSDRDAIVKVTSSAICGSDLHLYDHYTPMVKRGDILGHEFMGEVVEVGPGVGNLTVGDRVVVPFPIACGACAPCRRGLHSVCENSNPTPERVKAMWGGSSAAIFGYSHLLGGYAGGQAEYVRVPFADVGPLRIEDDRLTDEQVLFLSDIFPTGYFGADLCDLRGGEVVAVWGAGPVGQFAIRSAYLLGAEQVIAIDRVPERLRMAREGAGASHTLDYEEVDVLEALEELTGGRGPDACIEAVGMEAHHAVAPLQAYDKGKQLTRMQTDRAHALRQAVLACASGGTVSVLGVFGGFVDKFPMGAVVNRALSIRAGQAPVHRYMRPLLEHIERGDVDPRFVITHRMSLEDTPAGYELFKHKQDDCVKVVLTP